MRFAITQINQDILVIGWVTICVHSINLSDE